MQEGQLRLFEAVHPAPAVSGDADLGTPLAALIAEGFPHVTARQVPSVEVRWNGRLRTTVGRVTWPTSGHPDAPPVIDIAPRYHDEYPEELRETLAHEFAHVVTPGCGHGPAWKRELADALARLGLEVRDSMRFARNPAPQTGDRYTWTCAACGTTFGYRPRRRPDEVAAESPCCKAHVVVLDRAHGSLPVPPRAFEAVCTPCGNRFRAYDDAAAAVRFARRHMCGRCGKRLRVAAPG